MTPARRRQSDPTGRGVRAAALLAVIGFAGLALFQAALALGAPWGHAAWGGADAELAAPQRIGSGLAVVVWSLAAVVVLECAGLLGRSGPRALARRGTWLIAALCGVSALANFASQSTYENLVSGPLAVVLSVLCGFVAWSAGRPRTTAAPVRPRSLGSR